MEELVSEVYNDNLSKSLRGCAICHNVRPQLAKQLSGKSLSKWNNKMLKQRCCPKHLSGNTPSPKRCMELHIVKPPMAAGNPCDSRLYGGGANYYKLTPNNNSPNIGSVFLNNFLLHWMFCRHLELTNCCHSELTVYRHPELGLLLFPKSFDFVKNVQNERKIL